MDLMGTVARGALAACFLTTAFSACDSGTGPTAAEGADDLGEQRVVLRGTGAEGALDKPVEVAVDGAKGRITDVTVTDAAGRRLAGRLGVDGTRWHSTAPLAADAHYTVRVVTEGHNGAPGHRTLAFETAPGRQTLRVDFGPRAGTYGVGQPLTARLSTPVGERDPRARALVEGALRVESDLPVEGAWYWVNDRELHYRPKDYWPAHAEIRVSSALDGIRIEDGLYGARSVALTLRTGERVEAVVDARAHIMTVRRGGRLLRTIPVTTGKPGFDTRNGIKVVLGKERYVRMRGTSIGIPAGSPDAYDTPVSDALRVTLSGEYLHAAPWSVGSQGRANVTHGCTGMSARDAAWLFDTMREGDIVTVVNSGGARMPPFGNGFGDWNLPWNEWREGGALSQGGRRDGTDPGSLARLRPDSR
jgi:lipoprotein-anchoring transpeptidase ErfK/SrfK